MGKLGDIPKTFVVLLLSNSLLSFFFERLTGERSDAEGATHSDGVLDFWSISKKQCASSES
jgi:hypothetical protein